MSIKEYPRIEDLDEIKERNEIMIHDDQPSAETPNGTNEN
jgi:hypothetical protein